MTALSLLLSVRWRSAPPRRVGPRVPPLWPVVLIGFLLWGVVCCAGAEATPVTEPDWVGRSRDEVVEQLGRPLSTLQRGDTEILMYPNNVRFEIREGEVAAHRTATGAMIVASDGTRYTPTERGRLQRMAPPEEAEEEEWDEPPVRAAPQSAPGAAATAAAAATNDDDVADAVAEPEAMIDSAAEEDETWMSQPADSTLPLPKGMKLKDPLAFSPETIAENGLLPSMDEEEEVPEPSWVRPVQEVLGVLLRFGFAFVILRIAISWVELPCYNPDVAKVAALYVVVREGLHALGGLEGHWQWLRLFRLDDGLSYVAMMYLLFKFKVALSGLTALKIATATVGATYLLMLIFGLAISFALGGLF